MREIKFRGKRVNNGEWVYGWYIKANGHWNNKGIHEDWIICHAMQNGGWFALGTKYPVIAETVGQYTGLKDKNGKEIYEGDVVRIEHDITETQSLGSIENKDLSVWEEVVETFEVEDVVVFVNGSFDVQEWAVGIFMPYEIEVIGNIHDKAGDE